MESHAAYSWDHPRYQYSRNSTSYSSSPRETSRKQSCSSVSEDDHDSCVGMASGSKYPPLFCRSSERCCPPSSPPCSPPCCPQYCPPYCPPVCSKACSCSDLRNCSPCSSPCSDSLSPCCSRSVHKPIRLIVSPKRRPFFAELNQCGFFNLFGIILFLVVAALFTMSLIEYILYHEYYGDQGQAPG
uniref:Uncharacterized protein n=1 Tax=Biomphalaria glabrata TaxID=6526 RepID=A0A2C9K9J0_BIOGL